MIEFDKVLEQIQRIKAYKRSLGIEEEIFTNMLVEIKNETGFSLWEGQRFNGESYRPIYEWQDNRGRHSIQYYDLADALGACRDNKIIFDKN